MALTVKEGTEDSIVAKLYGGALNPADWYEALDTLRRGLGAVCFHSFTISRRDHTVLGQGLANIEVSADKVREYEQQHAATDTRMALTRVMPLGVAVADHDHFGVQAISRSPIYMDWLRPIGLRYTLAMSLRIGDEEQEVLGFIRGRDDPPYGAEAQAYCQRHLQHLVKASELRTQVTQIAVQAAIGLAALDTLSQGIVIVDGACRIHHLNRRGETYTNNEGLFTVTHGRIAPRSAHHRNAFEQLVSRACQRVGPAKAGVLRLFAGCATLSVSVLPLEPSHSFAAMRPMPMALVVITDPRAGAAINSDALRDLLGITPAEARLALLLTVGKTVKDFAEIESCSWHTARTHLRNLLRKSGCHRQVELVQLVQSLQAR